MTGWVVEWGDPNGISRYVQDDGEFMPPDINKALVFKRKQEAMEYVLDDEKVVKVEWTPKKVKVVKQ